MNTTTDLPASCNKNFHEKSNADTRIYPRFIMLGGFLGAGKTTTLLKLAWSLKQKGLRVGLITNDQAEGLVDTALLEELDLPVREIAGGCFCCRSETLVQALDRLEAENRPQVFLAEPVGSCTDLVATVSLPLKRIYFQGFTMAPYAVVVDPYRAMQSLGVEGTPLFSPDVNYIFRKQLEEAEVIAINKVDVISPERLASLRSALTQEYPEARLVEISSRGGQGLEALFDILLNENGQTRRVMEVDYERYAAGEARLGWLNIRAVMVPVKKKMSAPPKSLQKPLAIKVEFSSPAVGFSDPNDWLMCLATGIAKRLSRRKIEIAHLKLSLSCGFKKPLLSSLDGSTFEETSKVNYNDPFDSENNGSGQSSTHVSLAAVQLTGNSRIPEVTRQMNIPFHEGHLLINLRAEGDPDILAAQTFAEIATLLENNPNIAMETLSTEHFRPGKPVPTHRIEKM